MPPAGHAPTGGGGKHHGHGNGGGDAGADFLDFKKSHEYNWNRLVWAHGWQKIHSGGPKALESSWKYLPPNGRFGGPGAVEGRDYFATLDDVLAFVKKAGAGALPSSRAPGQQHGGQQPAPAHAAAAATPAPQQQPAPSSSSSLAATAALAEQGRARVEGMSKRQRLEAVFLAAFSGDAALLAALVKADKSLLKAEAEGGPDGEDEGATPLLVASRRGHADCVRVLLDEGPVEMLKQVDARGRSALHSAARGDHAPVARLLVERGLKPTFRRPEEGHTPLMVAARHNAARVARILLQECPTASQMTQLKIRNNTGESAYTLAVRNGSHEVAQLLLQAGADPTVDDARPPRSQWQAQAAAAQPTLPPQQQQQQQLQQQHSPSRAGGKGGGGGGGNAFVNGAAYRSEYSYVEQQQQQQQAPPPPPPPPQQQAAEKEEEDYDTAFPPQQPLLDLPTEAEAGPALDALNAKLLRAAIALSLGLDPRPHLGLPALPAPTRARHQQQQQQQQQATWRPPVPAPAPAPAVRQPPLPPPPPPQQQQQQPARGPPQPRPAQQQPPPGPAPAVRPQQPQRQQQQQQQQQQQARLRSNSGQQAAAASSTTRGPPGALAAVTTGGGWQEGKAGKAKTKKEAKRRQELLGKLTEEEMMEVPEDLQCPISLELLSEGVVCEDGYTYQRAHFEAWITQCEAEGKPLTSPMTRQPVSPIWFPNRSIRQRVEEYLLNLKGDA